MTDDDLRELDRQCADVLGVAIEHHIPGGFVEDCVQCGVWCGDAKDTQCNAKPYSSDPAACSILKKHLWEKGIVFSIHYIKGGVSVERDDVAVQDEIWAWDATEEEAVARFFIVCKEAGLLD